LGMRSDKASLAPAIIMRSGKTEIERKCIMSPQDNFTQMESCARPNHHMLGVKTELTLSKCRAKKTIGTGPMVPFLNNIYQAAFCGSEILVLLRSCSCRS
jgi:hypothetical protein